MLIDTNIRFLKCKMLYNDKQLYDVQKCNSVQIVSYTYVVQKAKSLNYFDTALKY